MEHIFCMKWKISSPVSQIVCFVKWSFYSGGNLKGMKVWCRGRSSWKGAGTFPIYFTKSSSAGGRRRHQLRLAADIIRHSVASWSWWWLFLYVKPRLDKCLCCQANVWCVLQLIMTLLNYFTLCKIVLCIWRKFIFFCHQSFIKKNHSQLSKNEPENIL